MTFSRSFIAHLRGGRRGEHRPKRIEVRLCLRAEVPTEFTQVTSCRVNQPVLSGPFDELSSGRLRLAPAAGHGGELDADRYVPRVRTVGVDLFLHGGPDARQEGVQLRSRLTGLALEEQVHDVEPGVDILRVLLEAGTVAPQRQIEVFRGPDRIAAQARRLESVLVDAAEDSMHFGVAIGLRDQLPHHRDSAVLVAGTAATIQRQRQQLSHFRRLRDARRRFIRTSDQLVPGRLIAILAQDLEELQRVGAGSARFLLALPRLPHPPLARRGTGRTAGGSYLVPAGTGPGPAAPRARAPDRLRLDVRRQDDVDLREVRVHRTVADGRAAADLQQAQQTLTELLSR